MLVSLFASPMSSVITYFQETESSPSHSPVDAPSLSEERQQQMLKAHELKTTWSDEHSRYYDSVSTSEVLFLCSCHLSHCVCGSVWFLPMYIPLQLNESEMKQNNENEARTTGSSWNRRKEWVHQVSCHAPANLIRSSTVRFVGKKTSRSEWNFTTLLPW